MLYLNVYMLKMQKVINKLCSLMKNNPTSETSISLLISRVHRINTSASACACSLRDADAASQIPTKIQNEQRSIAQIFKHWRKQFANAGISEPKQSIQYILAHVFNLNKISDLFRAFSNKVDIQTQNQIEVLCKKRLLKMPVQYILGEWQFRDVLLKMEAPVFIPRPETELLIDIILDELKSTENKIKMLEVCCGSGAISLALLKNNSSIEITAVDKSKEACSLSMKNAILHDLNQRMTIRNYEINEENRLQDVDGKFDVIVSNPPYVPSKEVQSVQPEIRFYEDLDALDGGPDGLDIIKSILLLAKEKLVAGGKLYLETDPSHPKLISHLMHSEPELGLKYVRTYKDFCHNERFVKLEKK